MMAALVCMIGLTVTTWIICTTILTYNEKDELGRRKYGK